MLTCVKHAGGRVSARLLVVFLRIVPVCYLDRSTWKALKPPLDRTRAHVRVCSLRVVILMDIWHGWTIERSFGRGKDSHEHVPGGDPKDAGHV